MNAINNSGNEDDEMMLLLSVAAPAICSTDGIRETMLTQDRAGQRAGRPLSLHSHQVLGFRAEKKITPTNRFQFNVQLNNL